MFLPPLPAPLPTLFDRRPVTFMHPTARERKGRLSKRFVRVIDAVVLRQEPVIPHNLLTRHRVFEVGVEAHRGAAVRSQLSDRDADARGFILAERERLV